MRQYEMYEIVLKGSAPEGSEASVDVSAVISHNGQKKQVRGFYAGNGVYKIRFLPEESGLYSWKVTGRLSAEGSAEAEPAAEGEHGIVRASGEHYAYEDGTWFYPFGTTVYALAHQTDELMDQTIDTIAHSPFNKVRMCVFPKHYNYNHNEPAYYAFRSEKPEEEESAGEAAKKYGVWNPDHPDFRFWDAFEDKIFRLGRLGVQVDLILFHPYDRWGFASMSMEKNLTYLDYLLRRFAAIPNLWWSMSNEYDLTPAKSLDDWHTLEEYVAANDPYRHLISSHNCFHFYDASRPAITHDSLQVKVVNMVASERARLHKPVMIDECCYEGNLAEYWGSISGKEMTSRFWQAVTTGGYCTHGETFLDKDADEDSAIVWWAKGGRLTGESPKRIAWLRRLVESFKAPIDPVVSKWDVLKAAPAEKLQTLAAQMPESTAIMLRAMSCMTEAEKVLMNAGEFGYEGHVDDRIFLWYLNRQTFGRFQIELPEDGRYKVEVLDTWNMTRETVAEDVSGNYKVTLPGREYMAILATRMDHLTSTR